MIGALRFDALRRAADRGVHVRLLPDDNNTRRLDPLLALDAHPSFEGRLFSPAVHRGERRSVDFVVALTLHARMFTPQGPTVC